MDRVIVIGNCQAQALEIMLSTNEAFTNRFELVSFPAVHEIAEGLVPELHRAVADASVVIAQQIDDGYRDGLGLGTDTIAGLAGSAAIVRWPSVFWAGYFPDLFYLRDAAGQPVVDGPFDYHDRAVLQAYASGMGVAATCRLLEDPDRASGALESAASATAELGVRGRDCDIHITSFIDAHFQEELLFFTLNHPANRLLGFIAQQITEFIGIPGRVEHGQILDEVLGSTFYPLHASHVRALGLRFGAEVEAGRIPFKIRGVTYEAPQAVQAFFDYYRANPQLVELNLDPRAA